jgi:hypothetical protein
MQELARALNAAVEKRRGGGGPGDTTTTALPARPRALGLALAFVAGVALSAGAWAWRTAHLVPLVAPVGGTLLVATEPPGASVTVDGKAHGQTTPTVVSGLDGGTHVVRATLAGRAAVEQHATLEANGRAVVQLTLPAANHTIKLETLPSGALVYVNGVLQVGQTPLQLTVADDEFYRLQLEKDGFELTSRGLTPDDRDPVVTVNLVPEKTERGTLMLDSDSVAEVWVDGANSGFFSPTVFRLAKGEHTLQLRDGEEIRSPPVRVKIKPAQATHLTLKAAAK